MSLEPGVVGVETALMLRDRGSGEIKPSVSRLHLKHKQTTTHSELTAQKLIVYDTAVFHAFDAYRRHYFHASAIAVHVRRIAFAR